MARTKKKVLSDITVEAAQDASQKFAVTTNQLAKLEASMNAEINKVKAKYQDQITDLKEALKEPVEILEVFAKEQKDSWGKKKSSELLFATIGFRTGNPKVTKSTKFTWEGVADWLKERFPGFVRTTEEVNKEAIIAASKEDDNDDYAKLVKAGIVMVEQDETFFVEPKKEEIQEAA